MTATYPLIVFGDVEQTLAEHLRTGLTAHTDTAEVHTRRPDPLPARMVLVRRAGGASSQPGLDAPRMDVQCWGSTDVDAHDLAQLVRGLMGQARSVGGIRGVTENTGPTPIPDETGRSRYLMTFDLTFKGATL